MRKRILAVVTDLTLFHKLEDLFRRAAFEVNRVPSGAGALVLIGNVRYDLVVAGLPLPDLGLQEFLSTLRALDSEGGESPVVVMAPEADVGPLAKALSQDLVRVLAETAGEAEIQQAVTDILGVAARSSSRLLVEVEVTIDGLARRRLVQTQNLSETGMLLRAASCPEIGTRVHLSFSLPDDSLPIETAAEIVRHADAEVEGLRGFAVRYLNLRPEDRQRIDEFVATDLEPGAAASGHAAVSSARASS